VRALVSGITGHLGREVARQLLISGAEVYGLTRQPNAQRTVDREVQLFNLDGSIETVIDAFEKVHPDVVMHLAGISRREHRRSDIAPFVEANIHFGMQLLEAMRTTGCERIITAGTYLQHYETDGFRAFNLYAATRQAFEDVLAFYVDTYHMSGVRLTLADIYSEHDTRPKLMTDIVKAWAQSTPLNVHDPEALVDLIHVEDAASAFLQAVASLDRGYIPRHFLSRYSVSSGQAIAARELVHLFERLAGRNLQITHDCEPCAFRRIKPRRGAPVPGWKPRITLENGTARILAHPPCPLAIEPQTSITKLTIGAKDDTAQVEVEMP
jgi:nucleoside-diphosphate-sugar epimerase